VGGFQPQIRCQAADLRVVSPTRSDEFCVLLGIHGENDERLGAFWSVLVLTGAYVCTNGVQVTRSWSWLNFNMEARWTKPFRGTRFGAYFLY